jgi:hypothetical protein
MLLKEYLFILLVQVKESPVLILLEAVSCARWFVGTKVVAARSIREVGDTFVAESTCYTVSAQRASGNSEER